MSQPPNLLRATACEAGRAEDMDAKRQSRITRRALGCGLAVAALASAAPASAQTVARGDFDGDGYGDLALGAPNDSVRGRAVAGAVNVLYGSAHGLTSRDQEFTAASPGVPGSPQRGARFGAALASGDLDHDGHADLAIGVPDVDVGAKARAGAVVVLYGSPSGLHPGEWVTQDRSGVKAHAESGDEFGSAVAIADFDRDGHGDLAIGAPNDSVGGHPAAGAVNVLYGRSGGLTTAGDQLWTQDTRGIKGIAADNAHFGAALAAGDVSANRRADLAIGIPGGRISGQDGAGAVTVLYGSSHGLSSVDDLWSQGAVGIKGRPEASDRFGAALAIGDFDGDDIGDLAVGTPDDSVGNAAGAGAVNVLYGSRRGLRSGGDQLWTEDTAGIKGRASIGEQFGSSLVAADFSRNGADDLAIGAPGTQVGGHVAAGAVHVLYGNHGRGLGERADQLYTQNSRGVKGGAERDDRFGASLGAGDFDADGAFDLAVGVPFESLAGHDSAGAANVLFGSGGGVRANPDEFWSQANHGVKGAVGNDHLGAALAPGRAGD
jgi:hypothetical protein